MIVSFVTDQPEITAHPQNKTRIEGDNVTLSCNVDGNPVPTISWTRDGSPVNTSARISFSADKKQLTITNVNRTDRGEYRCVASNRVGSDTSNAADLVVQCKTSIFENINVILTPYNVFIGKFKSQNFECIDLFNRILLK